MNEVEPETFLSANAAFAYLLRGLDQYANGLSEGDFKFFTTALRNNHFLLRGPNAVLMLQWHSIYSNTLKDSKLIVCFYDRVPRLGGLVWSGDDDAQKLELNKFDYRLTALSRPAWVSEKIKIHPDEMAEYLMKRLMHHGGEQLKKRKV